MIHNLILTYVICLVLIFCFFMMGIQIDQILRLRLKGMYNIVFGFFVYFMLFEIFYLPFFINKQRLTCLTVAWIIFLGIDMVVSVIVFRKRILSAAKEIWEQLRCDSLPYVLLSAVVFAVVIYYGTRTFYYGFDTAYYIGMVNSAVHYDRMLIYQSEMGYKMSSLDLRYGLSGFYMHTAVLCRVFKVSAIMMQKQGVTIIDILMTYCIAFLIGRRVFKKDVKYAYLFTAVYFAMNFFFLSEFAVGEFFMYRAYEAKAYCCNVVIPAHFLIMYAMMRSREIQGYRWRQLAILSIASIPVSMSSILIIPVLTMTFACSMAMIHRKFRYVIYGGVCCLANAVSLVVYYLYVMGKLVIFI